LLIIRDIAVTPLGLKTTSALGRHSRRTGHFECGDYLGFFKIRSITADEIILGENDFHLDFRLAVHRTRVPEPTVYIATWVRPHNCLGRMYLRVVLPFHALIVKRMLRDLM
jgi:hypothetical protein